MTLEDIKKHRPDVTLKVGDDTLTGKIGGEVPAYVGDPPKMATVAEVVSLAGIYHIAWDRVQRSVNDGWAIPCLRDYTY